MNDHLIRSDASDQEVKEWFRQLGPERQQKMKERYDHLLLVESGKFDPGLYGIYAPKGKSGSTPRPYPTCFPWMVKAWTKGLELLTEVMNESKGMVITTDPFALKLQQLNQI